MLADDDRDDRYFFRKALEALDMAVMLQTTVDGDELMDSLGSNTGQLPDVLFLDLNMPCRNGIECLTEMKASQKLKNIPVIVYSTSLQVETADLLYAAGAHYYMHKCDFSALPQSLDAIFTLLTEYPSQPTRDNFILNKEQI